VATESEIAWAAGLFEGEGCITHSHGLVLRLKSTDEDVIARFCEIVGAGDIYGPYWNRYADGRLRKPYWVWVCPTRDVARVLRSFAPWLGVRRYRRAREVGVFP
jgi:hypothetical protein